MRNGKVRQDALLTVKEYALLFRRHSSTVYTAITKGTIKYPVERPTGGGLFIRVPAALVKSLQRTS